MKLTAIPKSPLSHTNANQLNATSKHHHKPTRKSRKAEPPPLPPSSSSTHPTKMLTKKSNRRVSPSSNSSYCSACTESDDDSDSSSLCAGNKRSPKAVKPYLKQKNDKQRRSAAAAARSATRKKAISASSDSNSDSDSSDDEPIKKHSSLPSKTAAQRKFTKTDVLPMPLSIVAQNLADNASSSDMELPALVRAAIKCVESASDTEQTKIESNTHRSQYTSSLLQDFVAKTQALSKNLTNVDKILLPTKVDDATKNCSIPVENAQKSTEGSATAAISDDTKTKKRGRPRKQPVDTNATSENASESQDSGIASTPQIRVPSKLTNTTATITTAAAKKSAMTIPKKIDIATLEKSMYATERVLYPPRRKKQSAPALLTTANVSQHTQNEKRAAAEITEKVDPVWRKIDINKKFRRPSECGYRSDTNTICSKVLAKQSGYVSDYGNVTRRISSGYKSDCSLKAKSCGYRSDCSIKRRKIRRKRRTKTMSSTKPSINDQDLLLLAGLSLGHSDDSSNEPREARHNKATKPTKPTKATTKAATSNTVPLFTSGYSVSTTQRPFSTKASNKEHESKFAENENLDNFVPSFNPALSMITSSIYKDDEFGLVKSERMTAGQIRRRRSSAVSHCSSHCSTNSRHPLRRRRRRRLKSTSEMTEAASAQLDQDIDQLSTSFTTLSLIIVEKNKEKATASTKATTSKRGTKKRKVAVEVAETISPSTASTSASTKRRNKKAIQTKSPDDHKLPLKKRHYLMSPSGEKAENSAKIITDDECETIIETGSGVVGKAVTPKKRHLLQTPVDLNDVIDSTDATSSSTCKDLQETQASVSVPITNDNAASGKTPTQSKKNEMARKKNRLEGLVSKISPTTQSNAADAKHTATALTKSPSVQKNLTTKGQPKHLTTKSQPDKQLTTKGSVSKQLTTKGQAVKNLTTKGQPSKNLTTKGQPIKSPSTKGQLMSSPKSPATSKQPNPAPLDPSPKSRSRIPPSLCGSRIPPGVFEPSIDLELQIPFTEIPIKAVHKTLEVVNASIPVTLTKSKKAQGKTDCVVEKLLHRTGGSVPTPPKKKRKRPNRTGFPTIKKKKKPAQKPIDEGVEAITENGVSDTDSLILDVPQEKPSGKQKAVGKSDRISGHGGTAEAVVPRLMVVSLERLQNEPIQNGTHDENAHKTRVKRDKQLTDLIANEINEEASGSSKNKPNDVDARKKQHKSGKKPINSTISAEDQEINDFSQIAKASEVASGRKSKALESESNSTGRRGRSSANTPQIDEPKVTRTSKSPASSKIYETVSTSKPTEPVVSKKKSASSRSAAVFEVISKCSKKRNGPPNAEEKESEEDTATAKGKKRTHNGKVIEDKSDLILPLNELIDPVDNMKSKKKSRHDIGGTENKPKNHKQPATHRDQQENVKSKRARLDVSRETSKASATKRSSQIAAIKETVTSFDDIPPVDEWNANSELIHEPLPQEENVNHFDSDSEMILSNERENGKKSRSKKRYIIAGLFASDKPSTSQHNDEPVNGTLLPMPFNANYIMHKQVDFQLPYDVWYAHENDKLTRNTVHSWNFKKIRINSYSDSVKPEKSTDLQQCSCKLDYECGEMCLNRLVYTECEPESCPCGTRCQNTKIQRHVVARVERFMTDHKGWGVRAQEIIKKGTYILEYVGEVVTELEFKERMHTVYANDIHHYCLHLDKGLFIDGHRMGSDCRFVNHSCEPNCEMQKWSVNGLPRMALFAMEDIQPGQELTYDYNFSLFNPAEGQMCKCGSKECRGVIGGKSQRVRPIENRVSAPESPLKRG